MLHFEAEFTISAADFLGIKLIPLLTRLKNVVIESQLMGLWKEKMEGFFCLFRWVCSM
jgi:hypothetical protein